MSVAFGDDSTCSDIIEAKMIYIAMSAIKQVDILGVTEVQTDSSNCCKMFNVILNQPYIACDDAKLSSKSKWKLTNRFVDGWMDASGFLSNQIKQHELIWVMI